MKSATNATSQGMAARIMRRGVSARPAESRAGWRWEDFNASSCIGRPPFGREESGRPPLDEEHDHDQDFDFAPHGAEERFKEFVQHAQPETRPDRAGQL